MLGFYSNMDASLSASMFGPKSSASGRRKSMAQQFWGAISDENTRESALQTAIYGGVVNVVIIVAILLLLGAYLILQSFLKPLMWAVLCGFALFPFKHKATAAVDSWLSQLDSTNKPIALGLVMLPFDIFTLLSVQVEKVIFRWKRTTVAVIMSAVSMWMFYRTPAGYIAGYLPTWELSGLLDGWQWCYEISAVLIDTVNKFSIWWIMADVLLLSVLKGLSLSLPNILPVYRIISLPLKIIIGFYFTNLILGRNLVTFMVSAIIFLLLFLLRVTKISSAYFLSFLIIFGELATVYGLVWLLVVCVEYVLRPVHLNWVVAPLLEKIRQLTHLLISVFVRVFGPSVVWVLNTFGNSRFLEEDEKDIFSSDEDDNVTSKLGVDAVDSGPPALNLPHQQQGPPSSSHDFPPVEESTPHLGSILKQRRPTVSLGRKASNESDKQSSEKLSLSWDSSSLRAARRMSVKFAEQIESFIVEDRTRDSDSEEEEGDDDENGGVDVQDGGHKDDEQKEQQHDDKQSRQESESSTDSFQVPSSSSSIPSISVMQCEDSLRKDSPLSSLSSLFASSQKKSTLSPSMISRLSSISSRARLRARKKNVTQPVDTIFSLLFGACLLTLLLMYDWMLLIFVLIVGWIVVKKLAGSQLLTTSERLWEFLSPVVDRNIPGIAKVIVQATDKKVIRTLQESASSLVSVFIIILVVVAGFSAPVFIGFELYSEATHYLSVTANLTERVIKQAGYEGGGNGTVVENLTKEGYQYTRQWLKGYIEGIVHEDSSDGTTGAESAQLTQELLSALDGIYDAFFSSNVAVPSSSRHHRSRFTYSPWERMSQLVSENVGALKSVLHSALSVVKNHIPIISSLLRSSLGVILHGGQALVNFLFSSIIFLSTLFYLLSHSKHKYLPVEGILSLMPQQQGDPHQSSIMKAGDALTRAYRSVFLVTFKMALFYGLYTWFVHKLFFIEAAILPAG
jgi:hypothetical protein